MEGEGSNRIQLGDRGQPSRSRGCLRPRGRVDRGHHRGIIGAPPHLIEHTFDFRRDSDTGAGRKSRTVDKVATVDNPGG